MASEKEKFWEDEWIPHKAGPGYRVFYAIVEYPQTRPEIPEGWEYAESTCPYPVLYIYDPEICGVLWLREDQYTGKNWSGFFKHNAAEIIDICATAHRERLLVLVRW